MHLHSQLTERRVGKQLKIDALCYSDVAFVKFQRLFSRNAVSSFIGLRPAPIKRRLFRHCWQSETRQNTSQTAG